MKEINFIPLKGYNQKELISLIQGKHGLHWIWFFPGAERLPKEAVINGCLIITGRNGASNSHGDVHI